MSILLDWVYIQLSLILHVDDLLDVIHVLVILVVAEDTGLLAVVASTQE